MVHSDQVIDICNRNGIENGVPWIEDLFIDIVVLPSGEVEQLDEDELKEAYQSGFIDKRLFDTAWNEANKINKLIQDDDFKLIKLAKNHKQILEKELR
ncbi:DUF402 domain-containing protein [Chengkuizengella sp. SCS-71B]|uniref:DUF402 domain-containing protein n=1 Tax=Chengkuizengella sp. SCS-71B TaxID=3115290 RepID=UPI0032C2388B